MFKKCFTILLCLMMALVPAFSLAATQITVRIVPGEELSSIAGISDLSDFLSLKLLATGDACQLSVLENGNEWQNISISVDETGLYLRSSLADEKTYLLSWKDLYSAVRQSYGSELPEYDEFLALIISSAKLDTTNVGTIPADQESRLLALDQQMPGVGTWAKGILAKAVTETGEYTIKGQDPAETKTVVTLTEEDVISLFRTSWFKTAFKETAEKEYNQTLTDEQVNSAIDSACESLSGMPLVVECISYTAENVLVGVEITGIWDVSSTGSSFSTMSGTTSYHRLTSGETVDHSFSASFEAGSTQLLFGGKVTVVSGYFADAAFAFAANGQQYTISLDTKTAQEITTTNLSFYVQNNVTAIVLPDEKVTPFIRLNLVTETVEDPEESLVDRENAVNLFTMDQTALNALATLVSTNLGNAVLTLYSDMPASVQALLQSAQ